MTKMPKLLKGNVLEDNYCSCSSCEMSKEENRFIEYNLWVCFWMSLVLGLCLIASCEVPAHAEVISRNSGYSVNTLELSINGYSLDQWANAIYKAENSRTHPYGIMAKYRHTSPRQACINTVRHQYRNWAKEGHPGAFIAYLARHYAPVGAGNDPLNLNINWQRNVAYWLRKG